MAISTSYLTGQADGSIDHVVYLIGNTATGETNKEHLSSLKKQLMVEKNQFSVIHLGDILKSGKSENSDTNIDKLLNLVEGSEYGKILYTPGDMDWDNGGKNGLKKVRKLEKQIENYHSGTNNFLPSNGCPGPEVVDLSPQLRVIAINTQWWLHLYEIPMAPGTDCSNLTKEEFVESLEEAIEESEGRNILIIGHNPVISAGVYGGHMTIKEHLFPFAEAKHGKQIPLPLLGSFYAAYRQNVGTVRDMANKNYQELIDQMSEIMSSKPGLIYASAHDYNLQLLNFEEGYQVISGSFNEKKSVGRHHNLLFSSSEYGFAKITYFNSGRVEIEFYMLKKNLPLNSYSKVLFRSSLDEVSDTTIPVNRHNMPCSREKEINEISNQPYITDSLTKTAGSYEAKSIKKIFLGSLYRTTWSTPVRVPYMNLDTIKGGLKPFALGGGRQTTTLKFKTDDGKEYPFRSVDKDLTNALPREFRHTFISEIIKEVTATGHPYGALIVSSLLDETDILHARPKLYVLPDQSSLGTFREPYNGLFGMLEERPMDGVGNSPGFMGADDITKSMGLFKKLYKDNDNSVDAEAFGQARVFDIFIGDWSRHEDNWKWAGFVNGDKNTFYPIPRDRDHAFSSWNGLVPYLADREWAMPMIENFDYDFHDIKSLTWSARHLDRLLLAELNRNDWKRISNNLQMTMTDEAINRAISALPAEIIPVSGNEIGNKLKSRRDYLPDAIDRYYLLLASQVDILGSNKHEYFEIERLVTGNVRVNMYKKNKEGKIYIENSLYSREFVRNETKEIRLYGLDGADLFKIQGSTRKSIPVRIIGGPGRDEIYDSSIVKGPRKHTIIYDNESTVVSLSAESKNKISDDPGVNYYNRKSFMYNVLAP